MKKFLFLLSVLTVMGILHIISLQKISKLEAEISLKRNQLGEIQKEIERNTILYDEKADIEGIADEMQETENMHVPTSIEYFRINE